jgi:hypothetical protein
LATVVARVVFPQPEGPHNSIVENKKNKEEIYNNFICVKNNLQYKAGAQFSQ